MQYGLKPSDVYPHGRPKVPEGWQVVTFRPPLKGENFIMAPEAQGDLWKAGHNYAGLCPRLIVERVPPAQQGFSKTLCFSVKEEYGTDNPVIPKGWQAVDFRYPIVGNNFLDSFRTQVHTNIRCNFPRPRLILVPAPEIPVAASAPDWWE